METKQKAFIIEQIGVVEGYLMQVKEQVANDWPTDYATAIVGVKAMINAVFTFMGEAIESGKQKSRQSAMKDYREPDRFKGTSGRLFMDELKIEMPNGAQVIPIYVKDLHAESHGTFAE
ncbi:MAG TPA: hypothetical protein VEA58_01250, partial [Anaerovoracaceae bacterium]|nr:hypothetical protein [Anaerovoracaceae bacterium]